jgi:copper(I)-binding protein
MSLRKLKAFALSSALAVSAAASSASANEYKVGDLVIAHPIARATAPSARVGGGYVVIHNNGTSADRLIGGNAKFAGKVEIHEMKMENDVMRMKPIEGGLVIPAGEKVILAPGGNHIMFMKLSETLEQGATRKATLIFEKAGNVEVTFQIKSIAETLKLKDASKMDHSKMNHGGHKKHDH